MDKLASNNHISADTIQALVEARHDDPFAVLGPHEAAGGVVIRALVPGAAELEVVDLDAIHLADRKSVV